jgi:phosphatidylglycerophosphate synthase
MHQTEIRVASPEPSGLILVNTITSSRLILAGIFAWYRFLPGRQLFPVTLMFAAICATDLLDGFLARRLRSSIDFYSEKVYIK